MAVVTLKADGDTLVLPAPRPERIVVMERAQAEAFAAGGTRHCHDGGRERGAATLSFTDLTADERDALLAFWRRRKGALHTFVFIDEGDGEHEVHFAAAPITTTADAPDGWRMEVVLAGDVAGL